MHFYHSNTENGLEEFLDNFDMYRDNDLKDNHKQKLINYALTVSITGLALDFKKLLKEKCLPKANARFLKTRILTAKRRGESYLKFGAKLEELVTVTFKFQKLMQPLLMKYTLLTLWPKIKP